MKRKEINKYKNIASLNPDGSSKFLPMHPIYLRSDIHALFHKLQNFLTIAYKEGFPMSSQEFGMCKIFE